MNIETDQKTLDELTGAFRFSDAVLRHLVVNMDAPSPSPRPWRRPRKRKVKAAAGDASVRDDGDDDDDATPCR